MEREREAVDSEHEGRLNNDNVRLWAARYQLAEKNHPMAKFGCGNKKTLTHEDGDEEVYKRLHEFRKRYYTAQSMSLVIQSQNTLEDLEALVREAFSDVPNNGLEKETFGHPFAKDRFPCILKAVPIKKQDSLSLTWTLPLLKSKFKSQPLTYLYEMISTERNGGIKSYLKKKLWINGLSSSAAHYETFSKFGVSVSLTDEGKSHIQEITSAIFSYLRLLREEGPKEELWNEMKTLDDIIFKFYVESDPLDMVTDLVYYLSTYPPEDLITGPYLQSYEPELIQDCMDRLTTENLCMVLFSKDYADDCQEQEIWHKTKYSIEGIPLEWITEWKNVSIWNEFSLPQKNKYIADNLDMKECKNVPKYPEKIKDESYGELFYKYDNIFKQPKGYFKITMDQHKLTDNLTYLAATYIFSCFGHYVKNEMDAGKAGVGWGINCFKAGISIRINGWNDKMLLLLEDLLSFFERFKELFDQDVLQDKITQHKKSLYNCMIDPGSLKGSLESDIMFDNRWSTSDTLNALPKITKDLLFQVFDELFEGASNLQILVQGNFTQDEALEVFNKVKTTFNITSSCTIPKLRLKKLSRSENKILRVDGLNPKNGNTILSNYYQFGPCNVDKYLSFVIANRLMKEPTFDTLRTKEQLGYHVSNYLDYCSGILGFKMYVRTQATKFTADYVDERIETFLKWFATDKLPNITDSEFKATVDSLITSWSRPDLTLGDEVSGHWGHILRKDYAFDINERMISAAKSCDKDKCIRIFADLISPENPERRKLSVQVIGNSEGTEDFDDIDENLDLQIKYHTDGDNFITNIEEYRNSLEYYPFYELFTE